MILFLTDDLMFSSRVKSAASDLGMELKVVGTADKLQQAMGDGTGHVVLIDLAMTKLAVQDIVAGLRQLETPPLAVLAYGPHVHEKVLSAATEAGCDHVYTRGVFSARMPEILGQFVSG